MALKWKKNLRKIPDSVYDKLATIDDDIIIASCAIKIKPARIIKGDYKQVGISLDEGVLKFPERVLPKPDVGYYSKYNIYGHDLVHQELPMVRKEYYWDAPNYGDWDKGSHEMSRTRKVYQRDWIPPKYLEIMIAMVGVDIRNNHIFKFTVDYPMDRKGDDFEDNLLFVLNLLQENVGNHGVYPAGAGISEYLKSLYVNWEILPAGELEETVNHIMTGMKRTDPITRRRLTERIKLLEALRPRNKIFGTSGFQGYIGAQFADDLVVFENVDYGNAIYVMFSDWEELSKKTRLELLSSDYNFIRIPHTKTWKIRLRKVVRRELAKRDKKHKH